MRAGLGAGFLAIVVFASGCLGSHHSITASMSPGPGRVGERSNELPEAPCGNAVVADRAVLVPGDIVYVMASYNNCSFLPMRHEEDACGPKLQHNGTEWRLGSGATPLRGCQDDAETGWLAPQADRWSIAHWNGNVTEGSRSVRVPPGNYTFTARGIEGTVTVEVV